MKWILSHLRENSKLCLKFGRFALALEVFTDADMAGDFDNQKFTLRYLFTFAGGNVSWQYKLQNCVALSRYRLIQPL